MTATAPQNRMIKRIMRIFVFLFVVCFLLLIVRIGVLQIYDPDGYEKMAIDQQLSIKPIPAQRGTIYDRDGRILAKSVTVWQVIVSPNNIKDEKREDVAQQLSQILSLDYEKVRAKVFKTASAYEIIKTQISAEEAEKVRQYKIDAKIGGGISLLDDYERSYPYGDFAAAVLGFTGSEHQGLEGIEKEYDEALSGTSGRDITMSNAKGGSMYFPFNTKTDAQNGNSLILTIDAAIQQYLEKNLEIANQENKVKNRVCGIIMDVNSGEILGMASKPDFDPNDPFTVFNDELRQQIDAMADEAERKEALALARNAQWRNKAITEVYEPGSVFKVITGSSALDAGAVSPEDTFYCDGSVYLPEYSGRMHCWRLAGHGTQDFAHALMNSCNPAFVAIGRSLGADAFYKYFKAYGFTEKTGIDLPGEENSIYHKKGAIGPVELATSSYGQTFKVTPIQMITAVAAAVNGGKIVTPHVVKSVIDDEGKTVQTFDTQVKRQVISAEVSSEIALMMEQVVAAGSGKNAYVNGYRIGGKTGTSQKTETRGNDGQAAAIISSFMGIAPADDPQVACLVFLDEPYDPTSYGSAIAAPVVGKIFAEVLPELGIEPRYTEKELTEIEIPVPIVLNRTSLEAEGILREKGLGATIIGEPGNIIAQVPSYGNTLKRGGNVIIYTESAKDNIKTTVVPDVIGCTPAEANARLTNAGLNIRILQGALDKTGLTVSSQTIAKGAVVDMGTIVGVEFISRDTLD